MQAEWDLAQECKKIMDKMERLGSGGELTLQILRKGKLMPLTMLLASR